MLDQPQPRPAPPPPAVKAPAAKRKRGGQPGNQNARKAGTYSRHKPGPLSHIPLKIAELNQDVRLGLLSTDAIRELVHQAISQIQVVRPASDREANAHDRLVLKLIDAFATAYKAEAKSAVKRRALEEIARDPFDYFERWYKRAGVSRDADSFFIVSEKSAQNSPLPPQHPPLATNLTDEAWALLAPLVPPDPFLDHIYGQPPVIIAANRWKFTRYIPTGEIADFTISQEYMEFLRERLPHLVTPPSPKAGGRKRGRPRKPSNHPRALLDAILWKLATGHTWQELPSGFPTVRACQKYYRRLFRSGRFHTMLLALYNHMRLEMCIDPWNLLEAGLFTTTPGGRIALVPEAAPTSENYTALLFMQLARAAYMAFERDRKGRQPLYTVIPVFKGQARLSTARLLPEEPQQAEPEFIPIVESLLGIKMQTGEREQKALNRQAARRARSQGRDKKSTRAPAGSPASPEAEKLPIEKIMGSFQDSPAPLSASPEVETGAGSSEEDLLRVLQGVLETLGS